MFAITAIAILPVLAMAGIMGLTEARAIQLKQEASLHRAAHDIASGFDQELQTLTLILNTLAATADSDGMERRLRDASDLLGTSIELHPVASANEQTRLVIVSEGDDPLLRLIVPVRQSGHVAALLDLVIPRSHLARLLTHSAMGLPGTAQLIDPQGTVVAISDSGALVKGPATVGVEAPAQWGLVTGPSPGTSIMFGDGTGPSLNASAPLSWTSGWRVLFGQDVSELRAREIAPLLEQMGAAAAGAIASMLLAFVFSMRLSRPLQALTAYASASAQGAEHPREALPASSIAEFEALRLSMVRAEAVLRRRVAAERTALREARTGHELLDSVVNATAESIYVKDLELRYVLVNRTALLAGPEPLEEWQVLGRAARDLFPSSVARRMEVADRAVLVSGRMTSFEQDIDWPNQPTRWMWITVTPWQDAEGHVVGVVSVSRDITEQRAAAIRLRGMQADLLRATRLSAMGAMAGGLAHELNQPLAAATNYLNASARLLDQGAATQGAAFTAARGAVTDAAEQLLRAGAIVRRLRDFVGRGEAELHLQDVSELIRGVVDLARADGVMNGVDLRMVLAPHTATVLIDLTQMQQVLLNLLRNAAEAITQARQENPSRSQGVIVLAAVVRPPEGTCIDVIDNGPGLDPEIADRLFQPFISTKRTGMGIGLAICHTIVEGHGGRLFAEPTSSGGMRFRIALPPVPQSGQPI